VLYSGGGKLAVRYRGREHITLFEPGMNESRSATGIYCSAYDNFIMRAFVGSAYDGIGIPVVTFLTGQKQCQMGSRLRGRQQTAIRMLKHDAPKRWRKRLNEANAQLQRLAMLSCVKLLNVGQLAGSLGIDLHASKSVDTSGKMIAHKQMSSASRNTRRCWSSRAP